MNIDRKEVKISQRIKDTIGDVADAPEAAGKLAPKNPKLQEEFINIILQPTELLPGAFEFLQTVIRLGDPLVIWSQGKQSTQTAKIGTALIAELKEIEPDERSKRAEQKEPTTGKERLKIVIEEDKIPALAEIFENFINQGIREIIIVDDKPTIINKAHLFIHKLQEEGKIPEDVHIRFVRINQDKYKDNTPCGVQVKDDKEFITIGETKDLLTIEKTTDRTGWIVDWDRALGNTAKWLEERASELAEVIKQKTKKPIQPKVKGLKLRT